MWPIVVAGVVGFLAAGRTQPRTRCERKVVLGARTGRTYQVEEFPEAGFLMVRAPDAYGVFQHAVQKSPSDPRFSWRGGKGPAESLHGMCLDLGLVREPPMASPKPEAPPAPSRPTAVPNPTTTPAAKKTA